MKNLNNKVALVTGASRSLGFHIAAALIERGARVVVTGRDPVALADAASRLGPAALALPLDVRNPDSVRAVFAQTVRQLGRLDILVNNAAAGYLHRIDEAATATCRPKSRPT